MSYEYQAERRFGPQPGVMLGASSGSAMTAEAPPRDTIQTRLDALVGQLRSCEATAREIGFAISGPMPEAANSAKEFQPVGLMPTSEEALRLANRLGELLHAIRGGLA